MTLKVCALAVQAADEAVARTIGAALGGEPAGTLKGRNPGDVA
jgi:hypothetical protein